MSAEHHHDDDGAGPEACGAPWGGVVEDAVAGVPAAPVAAPALDGGAATVVRGGGRGWNGAAVGTPVLVPYSFATRDSSHYTTYYGAPGRDGFIAGRSEGFDAAQRGAVSEALRLWEEVSGLAFIEVPDTAERWSGGIRFQLENLGAGVLGQAYTLLPSGAQVTLQRTLYGDASMAPGTEAFWVLLHEIGHAIGLKHPFEGSPVLPAAHNTNSNTVMSYKDVGNHSRLGPLDVAAAQHLYGADAAEAALAVRWSRGPGGALHSTGNDAANAITGFDIRDVVRAGGGDDFIQTLGGHDDIRPGAGADTVYGGGDFDTVWAETPRRHATLVELGGAKSLALPHGADVLTGVETVRFFDGQVAFHADLPAGRVFRLYGAALGRAPDPVGFGGWVQALEAGAADLRSVAAGFVGSGEFAARFGAPDDVGFVSLLYANVLGRAPDAAGLDWWVGAMAAGTGRADALLGFSEAAEHKQRTAAAYQKGLWVADPEAVDVLRAYLAVLDRLPDAGGLASWTAAREAGLGQFGLVDQLVRSGEFQGRFGGLSNRDFVEQLYRTALDRPADAAGLDSWARLLDSGAESRTGVAHGFACSAEMTAELAPLVEDGIVVA